MGNARMIGPVTTIVNAIFSVWVGRDSELTTALLTALLEISF